MEDPEKKKLAWRIYRKYPDAAAYLSSDGAKPLWQISDHLQDSIKQQSPDLEIIHPNWSTKTLELWFVSREWDKVDGLRHAGTKEKEKQADDRLIVFWFYCDPGSEHEYDRQLNLCLGTAPGARPDDVKKLIGAMKGGPSSSQSIVVDEEPRSGSEWTTLWGRTFLTEDQLNQEDRDIVFGLIDDGWGRFLRDDLPKIRSVIAAHFTEPKRLGATP